MPAASPRPGPVAFVDADDTLWENNLHFERVIARFTALCGAHGIDPVRARNALETAEETTIRTLGYGAGPFCSSLRNALVALFGSRDEGGPTAAEMERIAEEGEREIRDHSILLLPGVARGIPLLRRTHRVVVLTKGRPDEQHEKVARCGLAHLFDGVEVVPEKRVQTYVDAAHAYGAAPSGCWMIGNSPGSDVNPASDAGMRTILVPHRAPWHRDRGPLTGTGPRTLVAGSFASVPWLVTTAARRA